MKKLSKKGVTLLEMIIAFAILAILIAVVSPFFFTNYKALNDADIKVELQRQGDEIIEDLTNNSMKCSKLNGIIDYRENSVSLDNVGEVSVKSVDFNVKEIDKNDTNVIKDKIVTSTFQLKDGVDENKVIEYVKIKPLPDGKSYNEANGIKITIKLEKRKITKELSTEIYFRN